MLRTGRIRVRRGSVDPAWLPRSATFAAEAASWSSRRHTEPSRRQATAACTGRRSPELGLRRQRHAAPWPTATSSAATASGGGSAGSDARSPPRCGSPRRHAPAAEQSQCNPIGTTSAQAHPAVRRRSSPRTSRPRGEKTGLRPRPGRSFSPSRRLFRNRVVHLCTCFSVMPNNRATSTRTNPLATPRITRDRRAKPQGVVVQRRRRSSSFRSSGVSTTRNEVLRPRIGASMLLEPGVKRGRYHDRKPEFREFQSLFGTDQENSAVPDHLVSANRYVTGWASPSEARFSSRFVLCLVSEWAIDWQASVSFLL